ncbi:MAG: hypothetical protein ACRC17_09770 [Culicoidibacterales bacterium]
MDNFEKQISKAEEEIRKAKLKKQAILQRKKEADKKEEFKKIVSLGKQAITAFDSEEELNLAIEFIQFHKQYLLDHQAFKKEHFENYKAHITFPNKQGQNNEWFLRQSLNQLPPNYPTPKSETSETKNTINQNQID